MSKSALLVIDLQNEYLPTGKLPLVEPYRVCRRLFYLS